MYQEVSESLGAEPKAWMDGLLRLSDEELLQYLGQWEGWTLPLLPNLAVLEPLVLRVIALATAHIAHTSTLLLLLSTLRLLQDASLSPLLPTQVCSLAQVLTLDNWPAIIQALSVFLEGVEAPIPSRQSQSPSIYSDLAAKAYALAMGGNLNSPTFLPLGTTNSQDFTYKQGDTTHTVSFATSSTAMVTLPPEELWAWDSRQRVRQCEDEVVMMRAQVLGAGVLMRTREERWCGAFWKSGPDRWMIPEAVAILHNPRFPPFLHSDIMNLFRALLHYSRSVHSLLCFEVLSHVSSVLEPAQSSGLLQCLLRDIAESQAEVVPQESADWPEFGRSVLRLVAAVCVKARRGESMVVQMVLPVLVDMLRKGDRYAPALLLELSTVLASTIHLSIARFREFNGLETVLHFLISCLASYLQSAFPGLQLLHSLFQLLETILHRWDQPRSFNHSLSLIATSPLIDQLHEVFRTRRFEVFQPCISLLSLLLDELPSLYGELKARGVVGAVVEAMEGGEGGTAVVPFARLLAQILQHTDGLSLLDSAPLLSRTLTALFSAPFSANTAQLTLALREASQRLPALRQLILDTCLHHLRGLLDSALFLSKEEFWVQAGHMGGLLASVMQHGGEVTEEFLRREGLDLVLGLAKVGVVPVNVDGGLRLLEPCLQALNSAQTEVTVRKLAVSIVEILDRLEGLLGPLRLAADFSSSNPPASLSSSDYLLCSLSSLQTLTQAYVILLRMSGAAQVLLLSLLPCIAALGQLYRLLIYEEARMKQGGQPRGEGEMWRKTSTALSSSIQSLLKMMTGVAGRGREGEEVLGVAVCVSETLCAVLGSMQVHTGSALELAYCSQLLTCLAKSLFHRSTSLLLLLSFQASAGLQILTSFLQRLQSLHPALCSTPQASLLEELWTAAGQFYECVAMWEWTGRMGNSSLLSNFGVRSAMQGEKGLKLAVLDAFEALGYVECAGISTGFMKSVFEVLSSFFASLRQPASSRMNPLLAMGFSTRSATQALSRGRNIEAATDWLLTHPQAEDSAEGDWTNCLEERLKGVGEVLVRVVEVNPALSASLASLLAPLSASHPTLTASLLHQLLACATLYLTQPLTPYPLLKQIALLSASSHHILKMLNESDLYPRLVGAISFISALEKAPEVGTLEPVFTLLTALIGKAEERLDLIAALTEFLSRERTLRCIATPGDFTALLELISKATVSFPAAAAFLNAQGLYHLLQLERGETQVDRKAISVAVDSIVRQMVVDEGVLERKVREAASKLAESREVVDKLDKDLRRDIGRAPEVAVRAVQSVASLHQSPGGLRLSPRPQPFTASLPLSALGLAQLLQALSLLHQRCPPSLLPADLLLSLFGDNLRRFPDLFPLVQGLQFTGFDPSSSCLNDQFLISHLLRAIFPCYLGSFVDGSESDCPSFPVSKVLNGLLAACPNALLTELAESLRDSTKPLWTRTLITCLRLMLKEVQAEYSELAAKVVDKEYGYVELVGRAVESGGEGVLVMLETMEILIRLELIVKAPVPLLELRSQARPSPNARLFDPSDSEFHPSPDFSPIPYVPSDSSSSPIPSEGLNGRVHFSRSSLPEELEEELGTGLPPFGPRLLYYRHQTMMPHYEEADYLDMTLQLLRRRHHYPAFYAPPFSAPDLGFQAFLSQCQAMAQPELLPPPLPHIDSSFLEALPENIRREVLHTLQRPPSRDTRQRPLPEGPIIFGRAPILPGYTLTRNIITEIGPRLHEGLYSPSEGLRQSVWEHVGKELNRHNKEVLGELLVAMSVQEGRAVVEGLMRAMERGNGQEAAQVVDQVLCFLQLLLKRNPFMAPLFFASTASSDLPLLQLISLLAFPLYATNSAQQFSLLSLLSVLFQDCAHIPSLPLPCLAHLCDLLFTDIQEKAFALVSELIKTVGSQEANRKEMERTIGQGLEALAAEVEERLGVRGEGTLTGKMVQLLRLCKVIKTVNPCARLSQLQTLWEHLEAVFQAAAEETESSRLSPKLARILPLVEAFFVAHNDPDREAVTAFFTPSTRKILNLLIKENPNLLASSLSHLSPHFSCLLDFDNKREHFRAQLKKLHARTYGEVLRLKVSRGSVLADSFHRLKGKSAQEWLGRLEVDFQGEEGLDLGGPTREWFSFISQDIFNANYALFILAANGASFQPNPRSYINPDHLDYFTFIGRVIGKALLDGLCLEVHFTRSFYKHILGQEVTVSDLEDLDPDMYKGLQSLLTLDLDSNEVCECYFSYEEEHFGTVITKELIPDGKQIRVTEQNKGDYVKRICSMKMTDGIQPQITAFLAGLYSLIPQSLLGLFDARELELVIAGIQEIDVSDLREHTEYQGYGRDAPAIRWFWEVVEDMAPQERALLLQFVTGSSKVPLEGFRTLRGSSGIQRFQIHKSYAGPERLPTAHTCFNQLDLPDYPSKDVLRNRLMLAISEGSGYFGLV